MIMTIGLTAIAISLFMNDFDAEFISLSMARSC